MLQPDLACLQGASTTLSGQPVPVAHQICLGEQAHPYLLCWYLVFDEGSGFHPWARFQFLSPLKKARKGEHGAPGTPWTLLFSLSQQLSELGGYFNLEKQSSIPEAKDTDKFLF